MTAKITLSSAELLFDIYNRSHAETASIADADIRYRAEARQDKEEILRRYIRESQAELGQTIGRYLKEDFTATATDALSPAQGDITIELSLTARRLENRIAQLTDRAHSFIVNRTLSKFYASAGQGDLAAVHTKQSADELVLIDRLIFTKTPPIL